LLFPSAAVFPELRDGDAPPPAGGLGGGTLRLDSAGAFRGWRPEPGQSERDEPAAADRFYLWWRSGASASHRPLTRTRRPERMGFPFTWRDLTPDAPAAPRVETLAFSPLLPGDSDLASLPLHVVVFRVNNPFDDPLEAALLLTWAAGWPDPLPGAVFDLQHDNLCLTGSLGDPADANRQGIAVPDLHYAGISRQGIEPWRVSADEDEVLEDFAEDGELDPRVAHGTPQGAAAWVKFDLEPGETKEVPFVLAWHLPLYAHGPLAGEARFYTQFLGRRRPDNAVVWLAEQAVQHHGGETPNYDYWMRELDEWRRAAPPEEPLLLRAALEAGVSWAEDGRLVLSSPRPDAAALLHRLWPDARVCDTPK
jgi:hypothetical protein